MLFNSIEFAIFLPIVFLLYWFVFNRQEQVRNLFIIAASYLFYGWWDWRFLLLIAFTSLCSYLSGLGIEKVRRNERGGEMKARWISGANIVLNLGILGIFKYYNFFVTEFAARFLDGDTSGLLVRLILPVGISFYTFQALSYSIDVYRRKLDATHDITAFFAYIAFFPQLVAGPIERATNLLPQFYKLQTFDYTAAVDGGRRILWGLFKKIVVADSCAGMVNRIFADYQTLPGSTLLIGALLFAFQIYGDFSGYSDIAIGTARLFGFRLMQNFRVPYFSRDIAEFWRRWHISLNTWFRDYIYIPLGGSRVSKPKVIRNTFIIFLVSGFWHGANWTFLAWGAYHALLFMPLILLGRNRHNTDTAAEGRMLPSLRETASILLTFALVVVGWVLFRAETIGDARHYLQGICSPSLLARPVGYGEEHMLWQTAAFIFVLLLVEWIQRNREHGLELSGVRSAALRWIIYYAVIISLFFGEGVETFIYFQF